VRSHDPDGRDQIRHVLKPGLDLGGAAGPGASQAWKVAIVAGPWARR
jgi:hypothetical protein